MASARHRRPGTCRRTAPPWPRRDGGMLEQASQLRVPQQLARSWRGPVPRRPACRRRGRSRRPRRHSAGRPYRVAPSMRCDLLAPSAPAGVTSARKSSTRRRWVGRVHLGRDELAGRLRARDRRPAPRSSAIALSFSAVISSRARAATFSASSLASARISFRESSAILLARAIMACASLRASSRAASRSAWPARGRERPPPRPPAPC